MKSPQPDIIHGRNFKRNPLDTESYDPALTAVGGSHLVRGAALFSNEMDEHFNLYYLHWWTLVYFLFHFEEGKYASGLPDLVKEGAASFHRLLIVGGLASEYENEIRLWMEELD